MNNYAMASYANSLSDHVPLSVSTHYPFLTQPESAIVQPVFHNPIFHNPTSLPISTIISHPISYGEMQSHGIDFEASTFARRHHRLMMRRESRSKERHPYQISEKRSSKYKTRKYNSTLQACLLQTNNEVETKGKMKLLVRKQLQNSDVSNLRRVLLPKKAVEVELPPLQMNESITISAVDFENGSQWHFNFRFWPINASRMYVLENTGDFIQQHGLKKGDFLMLYRAEGKYVIRGMKATESEHSNSATCTAEEKLESSEDGGDKISLGESDIVSQGMDNTNTPETTPEISQSILPIKEDEVKVNIMDHEPELQLDRSSTHSGKTLLISQGLEYTNMPEITSEINEEQMNILDTRFQYSEEEGNSLGDKQIQLSEEENNCRQFVHLMNQVTGGSMSLEEILEECYAPSENMLLLEEILDENNAPSEDMLPFTF